MHTDTQSIILLIEVGVLAGVGLLTWLGIGPRRSP